jgi:hypothetical protein
MSNELNDPRNNPEKSPGQSYYPADQTPRREGGDDALAETTPTDATADEKVIVNQQREDVIVNAPSPNAPDAND